MDNLKSKGIKAFIWDFSGKLVTQGMGFIFSIFLARLLEPSEFGLIAMIMVIIGIAGVFTDVGLGGALIQRKKVLPVHYSSVFYFNIFVGSILTLITYFSAGWIGEFYKNDKLVPLTQVMSLLFIINAFSSVQTTKLRKDLNYGALTKANFVASLISGSFGVYLAFHGAGVWSLVAQTLSMSVIYNIFLWLLAKWMPSLIFSWKALLQLWGFGFRMFLVGLLDAIYMRMDYLIIGKLFSPATLGFFQRAKSLNMMAIQYSSGSLMSVLFPMLSKVQNDVPRFQNIVIKVLGIISFVSVLLFGTLYLISEELIVLLFTEKWMQSVDYFKILAFSGFAYPINALLVNVLSSRGNSKAFLRMAIAKKTVAFTNLGVGFLYGIEGYLYGLIIVAVINTSVSIVMAARESGLSVFSFYKLIVTQTIIAGGAIIITLYLVDTLHTSNYSNIISLLLKGSLFTCIYFLINRIFRTSSFTFFIKQVSSLFKRITIKIRIFEFRKKTKVFCIGQNKTGTTSIELVLKKMGYKMGNQAKGEMLMVEWVKRDFRNITKLCKTADAFQDIPFSNDFTFAAMDYAFPNSKFILTVRKNKDEWYNSLTRFHTKIVGKDRLPTVEDLKEFKYRYKGFLWDAQKLKYGIDEASVYDYKVYTDQYEMHNHRVKEYFRYRPDDLLVIDVSKLGAIEKIYQFLDLKYDGEEMPHLNQSKSYSKPN